MKDRWNSGEFGYIGESTGWLGVRLGFRRGVHDPRRWPLNQVWSQPSWEPPPPHPCPTCASTASGLPPGWQAATEPGPGEHRVGEAECPGVWLPHQARLMLGATSLGAVCNETFAGPSVRTSIPYCQETQLRLPKVRVTGILHAHCSRMYLGSHRCSHS